MRLLAELAETLKTDCRVFLFIALFVVLSAVPGRTSGPSFDQAPPALDYYLQRLPGKSIGQILVDLGGGSVSAWSKEEPLSVATLEADFRKGPSAALVEEVDRLIVKARTHYAGPDQVNLLHDLRDLAANAQATGDEMGAYVNWRFAHLKLFHGGYPENDDGKENAPDKNLPELDAQFQKASPAMQPHWLYLKGAYLFKGGQTDESNACFDQVLKQFSNATRAEAALFMKARSQRSQVVPADDPNAPPVAAPAKPGPDDAQVLFEAYLTKYPKGRFTSDAIGWLGGIAYGHGDMGGALILYLRQLDDKAHPENFAPATDMIEKILTGERNEDAAYLDQVAQHPPLALALAYLVLNTSSMPDYPILQITPSTPDDEKDLAELRAWRRAALPKLGEAILKHQDLYQGEGWPDRYDAILAHSASDQGDQKQAAALIAMGGKSATPCDDLLFVKALVLQRSGDLPGAEAAYRDVLEKCPQSALAAGTRYRLALVLHDEKKDGDALVQLALVRGNHLPLRPLQVPNAVPAPSLPGVVPEPEDEDESKGNPFLNHQIDYSGASDEQVDQTMDALLNFAPLPALETALLGTEPKLAEFRADLAQVLQERYLCQDDFRGALKYADLARVKAEWTVLAEKSDALKKAAGPASGQGSLEMADYWLAHRKLLSGQPLDSLEMRRFLFNDDAPFADYHRLANGGALNFTGMDDELESRDGLWHAVKWWGAALATGHDEAVAPKALWGIIEARRKIAIVSPYTLNRAVAGKAQEDSRKDYDHLVADYPNSPEAKNLAVYWTFPTAEEVAKVTAGSWDYFYDNEWGHVFNRDRIGNWLTPPTEDRGSGGDSSPFAMTVLSSSDKDDFKTFAKDINELLADERQRSNSMDDMPALNFLEDLALLGQVPGVDRAVRTEYINLRLKILDLPSWGYSDDTAPDSSALRKAITAMGLEPGAKPIEDFVAFLQLAVTAKQYIEVPAKGVEKDGEPLTYTSKDYPLLARQAADFLDKYPKSPKREAARLLQIRGLVWAARPKELAYNISWPAGDIWDTQYAPLFLAQTALDRTRVAAAFAAFDAEFKAPQYPNSMLSLRADAALIQHQWGVALDDLWALHEQKTSPEFYDQVEAGLGGIFEKLDQDEYRHDVLEAILKRPAARENLSLYLRAGGLKYLRDYLTAKMAGP